ncbi:MAG: NADH-quinone oxidoreductase subunit L [Gammaproteobacteria bacterium]|nr:NADH-quinone oxidoreductase subunit L [Gammaproteobacteria bacterium]
MMNLLWLIPTFPLAGFLILCATEGKLPKVVTACIGAGSVGLSAIAATLVGWEFVTSDSTSYSQVLWTWMVVGDFNVSISLYLDYLALVMVGVITGVGFLIHLYATGYMWDEEGYSRFFAYMNLFVFAMLLLVLGDSLLLLFLGWEGVGLCSYLLIGFFHTDPANGYAARKAFVVTRVGDTALILGLFLLFREVGTLDIQQSLDGARDIWPDGSVMNTAIALLLLGGAIGKSAQVPLQTWLPDAMAGPTPVSALIHAATMVTAGVYLIARMQDLYLLSETATLCVAVVGLVTLFIASFTALVQSDIKRVLAFSTMSQIGYMFFALGVGAWSAAIFHLMTHAFFKALLFLASGSVILALHHEQDMHKMGGLWRKLPIPFWSMLIGSAALAALPFTSGFVSKDAILLTAAHSETLGMTFWSIAVAAAFMTSLYTVRMMYLTFFGETKTEPHDKSKANMWLPLLVLSVLSIGGGWLGFTVLGTLFGDKGVPFELHLKELVAIATMCVPLLGVLVGYLLFATNVFDRRKISDSAPGKAVGRFWFVGWGFDKIYDSLIVNPFRWLARVNKSDAVDYLYRFTTLVARIFHNLLTVSQNGRLRWYALTMFSGLLFVLIVVALI